MKCGDLTNLRKLVDHMKDRAPFQTFGPSPAKAVGASTFLPSLKELETIWFDSWQPWVFAYRRETSIGGLSAG